MNVLKKFEEKTLAKAKEAAAKVPSFSPGDTVKVNLKIREGDRERIQAYEGICIARSNNGVNSSFTVRKISYGEGVERLFPLFSPRIESIELVRRGSVRRSKLYYLRGLRGKSARISERTTGHGLDEDNVVDANAEPVVKQKNKKKKSADGTKKAAAPKKAKAE